MDPRERMNDPLVALRASLQAWQGTLWTALPAKIVSYDASKKTVSAQPLIQAQVRNAQNVWSDTTLPVCSDCPVQFPGGGGYTFTFPLAAGDEGILVFSSRCLDGWWQQGGVQPQVELRMHDLSDGMFISGISSVPNVPASSSTNSAQLRTNDGTCYIELSEGGKINLVAPGGVFVNGGPLNVAEGLNLGGPVKALNGVATYAGDLQTTGKVSSGVGGVDSVTLGTHTHPNNGDPPTPGT